MKKSFRFSRLAAFLSAIVLFASLCVHAGGAPFVDVGSGDWFYESVLFVSERGFMKGVSDDRFGPGGNLTRGMCVTILYRYDGEPEVSGVLKFEDVRSDAYYADPVLWASREGVVYGRTETAFVPDGNIKRSEFAAMLYRYVTARGLTLPETRGGAPTDTDKIPAFAKDAVIALYRAEIINGKGGGRFDPDAYITRVETAAMIERLASAAPHEHEYTDTVVAPTCTEPGYTMHVCACGESYTDGYTDPLGHSFGGWTVTKTSTATEDGERTRTCTRPRCGAVETEPIPATGPVDPDAPLLVVSSSTAAPGGTVEIAVSVKNNPGVSAFVIGIDYDETVLTLSEISLSDGVPGQFTYRKNAAWVNGSDYADDGDLLVLSFTVGEDAPAGETYVGLTFDDGDISNYNEEDVFFGVAPGTVTVTAP